MKQLLTALLILMLAVPPAAGAAETPLPADLQEWMAAFQAGYLNADPAALQPVIPVPGWPVYTGGDWSYQYPPDWTVLSGDEYSFLACDSRQLACFDFVQVQAFSQPLTHDQLGAYALSRITGGVPFQVVGTFQKSVFPQLGLAPPAGIAQVWYISWQHPQAGNMFTLMQVVILSYWSGYGIGGTSTSWYSYTAPEDEFAALWESTFGPMYFSATYTIPRDGGTARDSDGDGYPDDTDGFPNDPLRH